MEILKKIKDQLQGKVPKGMARSDKWPKVRLEHLKKEPTCRVCRGAKKLEVHHIMPFHLHPQLELNPTNLVTLCESKHNGVNCHLWFGHLGNFQKGFNSHVRVDAFQWYRKYKGRK